MRGFDKGWVAYRLQAFSGWMKEWLPWVFGDKLEQVRVNGGGNGFLVTEDKLQDTSDRQQVVMVFWPQYLEWLGLGALFVTLMYLSFRGVRSRA